MRLLKYLQYPNVDENINKYRSLEISMLNKQSEYNSIVSKIEEEYKINKSIIDSINNLNKELKKVYKGDWFFQICLDEGKSVEEIIKNKQAKALKKKLLKINEEFSNMKLKVEKKCKNKNK